MEPEFVETVEYWRFPHKTLTTAVELQRERVERRVRSGDRKGLLYDVLSGAILTAFAFEATLNLVGHHSFGDEWQERRSSRDKVKCLGKAFQLDVDLGQGPLKTLMRLMDLRNAIAHAKPDIGVVERRIAAKEDSDMFQDLRIPSLKHVTPDFLFEAVEALDAFSTNLLESAGISEWEATNRSTGRIERRPRV